MNLRQKAKHYKQLADLYGAKTVQPAIVYDRKDIEVYECSRIFSADMTPERLDCAMHYEIEAELGRLAYEKAKKTIDHEGDRYIVRARFRCLDSN